MPGIIVGIDGSDHSRRALERALREAAVRHTPLTVLTVQQPATAYWGAGASTQVTHHARCPVVVIPADDV